MSAPPTPRLGFIVNPIAGMGGRVALKGTDGSETLRLARARGAVPVAPERARRALVALRQSGEAAPGRADSGDHSPAAVLAGPGPLGADVAQRAGIATATTARLDHWPEETTADDTRAAVTEMRDRGVQLLLFAGGDGTARDIIDAIGDTLPVIGVPTGVKMHSGVFASTPHSAGVAAARYLRDPARTGLRGADVADIDEEAARAGRVSARLYGSAQVPNEPALILPPKAASPGADLGLEALCRQLADSARDSERVTLFGPGTTTGRVLSALGLEGTLLGVDAVRGGALVERDLDESALLELLAADADDHVSLVLGVIGGQGSLLGRGNQQLSPRVLRRLGWGRITVAAAMDKLLALDPPLLRIDTGDEACDAELAGYVRVAVAPGRTIVMKVSS